MGLIQLNTDDDDAPEVKTEVIDTEDHIVIHESAIKVEHPDIEDDDEPRTLTIAPKPTMTLLSDEAKRIFTTSAPVSTQRRSSGSNPRAHRIVETENGREYIPDTNSNNILALDAIYPPADKSEMKKGFMLRPVGPGGQQRYICTVWQTLHHQLQREDAQEHPPGQEPLQLQVLQQRVFSQACLGDAWESPHRGETIQMSNMSQGLRGQIQLQLPQEDLSETAAASVRKLVWCSLQQLKKPW